MPIDCKFNNELNEVWHSSFSPIFALYQPKNLVFRVENMGSDRSKSEAVFNLT